MKKYLLWLFLICCLVFCGCGVKTINGVKIDDAQCKTLLSWVIAKNSYKTSLYETKNYDFDVFYSKNLIHVFLLLHTFQKKSESTSLYSII